MSSNPGDADLTPSQKTPRNDDGVFVALKERQGRFRESGSSVSLTDELRVSDAMRRLVVQSCTRKRAPVELRGSIYISDIYQSIDDPSVAYAETDRNGVPLDAPRAEWRELSDRFRTQMHIACHASDALTPDTRISLESSFVAPSFDLIGSVPPTVITWESLGDYARVVIAGGPGSGKTSCLRRLALDAARLEGNLPLFLQLRHQSPESLTIDGLARLLVSQGGEDQLDELSSALGGGRLLLLLDGLDEVPNDEHRRQFVDSITALCSDLPRIRIFVTSRSFTPELESLADFTQLALRPADDPWVTQWILLYFSKRDDLESAYRLRRELSRDTDLNELSRSPLLLSLLASSYRRSPRLLNDRADLLGNCVATLLTGWDSVRDVHRWNESDYTPRQLLAVLRELSARLLIEQRREFTLNDFKQAASSTLRNKPAIVVLDACMSSGLARDASDGRWEFSHRAFQDYLAASHLVLMTQHSTVGLHDQVDDPHMRRALSLSCSMASDPDDLLETVITQSGSGSESAAMLLADILSQESSASVRALEECADLVVKVIELQLEKFVVRASSPGVVDHIHHAGGHHLPNWACDLRTKEISFEQVRGVGEMLRLLHRACRGPNAELVAQRVARIQSLDTAPVWEAVLLPGRFEVIPMDTTTEYGLRLTVVPDEGRGGK